MPREHGPVPVGVLRDVSEVTCGRSKLLLCSATCHRVGTFMVWGLPLLDNGGIRV